MTSYKVKIINHVMRRDSHTLVLEIPKELSKEIAEGIDICVTFKKPRKTKEP
jgi:hypothetical protein